MPVQRRHRSAVACQECRRRKVRCNVTVTGIPCIRCAQDGTECTIDKSGPELPETSFSTSARDSLYTRTLEDVQINLHGTTTEGFSYSASPGPTRQFPFARAPASSHATSPIVSHDAAGYQSDHERQRDISEEQSGAEISVAARGNGMSESGIPFYTGEQPAVTAVFDVSSESQQPMPRHVLLKSTPSVSISHSDCEYLRHKGVFTRPQATSCRELLQAYSYYVHPILPILNITKLQELESPALGRSDNMLLFWSIAVLAVNFVPGDVWKAEGFTSRKEMKNTMYTRAKCMYDNGGETDKEVLLQSALLLSFWHSDRDNHSQPWYWSGIAISLCQIMGLHRDPDSVKFNPLVSPRRRPLWRRLWACCLFRDRWLSLTLGRPMRIHLSDCDMPLPILEDVLGDLPDISAPLRATYVPQDLSRLAGDWILLIQLSKLLGDVLGLCYQQLGSAPTLTQFNNLESELLKFRVPDLDHHRESRLAVFSHYHLQLHYQAVLITFYRHFVSMASGHFLPEAEDSWHFRIRGQMEGAATQTNHLLDCIAREQLIGFAGSMTPPLLVPAMHVHLLNCKSTSHLTRRLGFNKLELCMTIMRELQKVHTSASLFCGIFGEAVRQLAPGPLDETIWGVSREARPSTATAPAPVQDNLDLLEPMGDMHQPFINDDILESLLDESSVYNFWESINMPEQSHYE